MLLCIALSSSLGSFSFNYFVGVSPNYVHDAYLGDRIMGFLSPDYVNLIIVICVEPLNRTPSVWEGGTRDFMSVWLKQSI